MKLTEPMLSVTICMSLPNSLARQYAVITIYLGPPSRDGDISVVDGVFGEVIEKLTDSKASAVVCNKFRSSLLGHVAAMTTCFLVSLHAEKSIGTGKVFERLIQSDWDGD